MKMLKSFVTAKGERFNVNLHLSEDGLSDIEKEDLDFVRTRLPGGAGPLIPTIGTVEYKAFGPDMDHTHALRGTYIDEQKNSLAGMLCLEKNGSS